MFRTASLTTPQAAAARAARMPEECPICYEPIVFPIKTFCGHCFCYDCGIRWFTMSDQCPICRDKLCQGPPDPKAAINAILSRSRDAAMQGREDLEEESRLQEQRRDAFREAVHRILDAEAPNGEVWRIGALVRRLRNDHSAGRYEFEYDEAYEMLGAMYSEQSGIVVVSDLVLKSDLAEDDVEEAEVEDLDENAEDISDGSSEKASDDSEKASDNSDMDAAEDSGEESEAGDEAILPHMENETAEMSQ